MQTETAFILKTKTVSENDLILTLLSKSGNRFDAKLKSAKKVTSRNSSKVDILNLISVTLAGNDNQKVITDISLIDDFSSLKRGNTNHIIWLISEILEKLTLDNSEDLIQIFDIASEFLIFSKSIEKIEFLDKILVSFILNLILLSGFDINFETYEDSGKEITQDENRYFKFQDKSHNLVFVATGNETDKCGNRIYKILKFITDSNFAEVSNIELQEIDLKKLRELVLNWIENITDKKLNSRKLIKYK